ncbi:MAG: hypothetical protein PSX81_03375 [bacterium]|nr:hypothetical protein [bacterium]
MKFSKTSKFIFLPIIGAGLIALLSYVVMYLWNAILPEALTIAKPITFWQATGLLVLCKILFGGFKGGPNKFKNGYNKRMEWKEKMNNMSDEERAQFRAQWRQRCGRN